VSSGKVRLVPADSPDLANAILEAVAGRSVYVHLDCDVLEPGIVPTDFRVPGGLSLESLNQACSALAKLDLIGLEIAEFQYAWSENMEPASPLALVESLRPLLVAMAQAGDAHPLQGLPA
jgi:arginase family enzyme